MCFCVQEVPSYLEHTTISSQYSQQQQRYYDQGYQVNQPKYNEVQPYETSTPERPRYVPPTSQENPYDTYQQVVVRVKAITVV